MEKKGKIKVIKKGTNVSAEPAIKKKTTQASAREMVSNVTNWVTDFQQRRRKETKQAIENLFPNSLKLTEFNFQQNLLGIKGSLKETVFFCPEFC